ncbi:MAG: phosphoribosyl-ATP diphosphatase [Alphaproteobacteria bacterium]
MAKDKKAAAAEPHILDELFAVIESRRGADPETSYTAQLLARGTPKIAQKVGEEAVETVIAATAQGRDDLAAESADLLYHLLVLWADRGLKPQDVWDRLAKHRRVSGLAVQKARKGG